MALARLTLRSTKGSPLTSAEADADLQYLEQLPIPAYSAIDAAISGAYPTGIVVDSKVNGLRYRLKPAGLPTVDPVTDTGELHWELLSVSGSGSTSLTSTVSTDTPVPAYTEDPTNAEILAQIIAQGTAESGGIHRYTTPLGFEIFYDVYEDSTPALAVIRKDDVPRTFQSGPPSPVNFRGSTNATTFDGSVICVFNGADAPLKFIKNTAGTWEQIYSDPGTGGGGTGTGGITVATAQMLDALAKDNATVPRATDSAPTAAEFPSPTANDRQLHLLPDGTLSLWEHDGTSWSNIQVIAGDRSPIFLVTTDPTGTAVPAGKYLAINTVTGAEYMRDVVTGDWIVRSTVIADLNTTLITIAGDAPAAGTIPAGVTALTGIDTNDKVRATFDNGLVFYNFDSPGYSEVTRELVSATYTTSTDTDAPVPAKIESPTDAEVLAQINARTPSVQPGSLHKYVTPTGNNIVFDVLSDGAGNLVLYRKTDKVRIYEVTVLPDPEQFVLLDVIELDGAGYQSIDDGSGGQAWQDIGDDFSSSTAGSQVQFDRHTVSATLGQQIYTLPNTPIADSVIVQIEGSGNNIDFFVVGNTVQLTSALASNVQASSTVVITYAY